MWTLAFWKDACERAIRTAAQTAAAVWTGAGTGLVEADWIGGLSLAGMGALLSLLVSIAGEATIRPTGTASLTRATAPVVDGRVLAIRKQP